MTEQEWLKQTTKEFNAFIDKCNISDTKYRCNLIRYMFSHVPIPIYDLDEAKAISDKIGKDSEKAYQYFADFVYDDAVKYCEDILSKDLMEQMLLVTVKEYTTFKDTFEEFKQGKCNGIKLFLQYLRFEVISDRLESMMHEACDKTADIVIEEMNSLQRYTAADNSKSEQILELKNLFLHWDTLWPFMHKAIEEKDAALLNIAAMWIGLLPLDAYYVVYKLKDC